MKFLKYFIILIFANVLQAQTLECVDKELVDKRNPCSVCNQDDELFTGLLITQSGLTRKIYAPYKLKIYSNRYFTLLDPYGNSKTLDVNVIPTYGTYDSLLTFLEGCFLSVDSSGGSITETDPTFTAAGSTSQYYRGNRTLSTLATDVIAAMASSMANKVNVGADTITGIHTHNNTSSLYKSGSQQTQINSGGIVVTDGTLVSQLDQQYLQFDNGSVSSFFGADSAKFSRSVVPNDSSNLFTLTELLAKRFDANKIMGRSIESGTPLSGEYIKFDGTNFVYDTPSGGGGFANPATSDLDMDTYKTIYSDATNDLVIESDSFSMFDSDGNKVKIFSEGIAVTGGSFSTSIANGGNIITNNVDNTVSTINGGEITLTDETIEKIKLDAEGNSFIDAEGANTFKVGDVDGSGSNKGFITFDDYGFTAESSEFGGHRLAYNFEEHDLYISKGDGQDATIIGETKIKLNYNGDVDKIVVEADSDNGKASIYNYYPKALANVTDDDVLNKDQNDSLYQKISLTLAELNTAVSDANIASLAGSETLTNKTVALGSNTVSGTKAQFDSAVTDGNFMYVGDTPSGTWATAGNTSIAALTLGSTDNTALTITAGSAAVGINATTTGAVNIANSNSSTGAIGIGNGNSNQTLNIGTSVGSGNKTLNIGSTIGTSYTTINSSSSGMDLASGSNTFIRATGSTTLSIASLGAVTSTINIGAIAGTSTLNVMNTGSGNKTVSMGSTVGSSATTLRSGSGNVNINDAGTGGVLIGTSTSAQTINIGDAAGAKTTTVGSTNTTSTTTLKAGSGGLLLTGLQTVTGATATDANTNANTTATGAVFIWNADTGGVFLMIKE